MAAQGLDPAPSTPAALGMLVKTELAKWGHVKNPMSEMDVERKFRDMAATRLDPERCEAVLEAVRNLEQSGYVARDLLGLLTTRKG